MRRLHLSFIAAVAVVSTSMLAAPAMAGGNDDPSSQTSPPAAAEQSITVERPRGQVVLSDITLDAGSRLSVTVTDTRADDPGWTVSVSVRGRSGEQIAWKPVVAEHSPAFTDGAGNVYSQQVSAGQGGTLDNGVLGTAPRGHGLGIARLEATLTTGAATADGGTVGLSVAVV